MQLTILDKGPEVPFWGYLVGLTVGGLLMWQAYNALGPEVRVEQYIANADAIAAQRMSKAAKARGEKPMNDVEAYVMDAPELQPQYVSQVVVVFEVFIELFYRFLKHPPTTNNQLLTRRHLK